MSDLRDGAVAKRSGPQSVPRFSVSRACEMVKRSHATIRDAEKAGRIAAPERNLKGNRVGYTLGEINVMREAFGTRPRRGPTDAVAVIPVQNFKGGVGKTTTAAHLAQYLAREGYRVLLVDCDSQASTTSLFGYVPDLDIGEDETLYPYLRDVEMKDLQYAVRQTHWDGLDLIPANLRLYSAEYEMAARVARGGVELLDRLSKGIQSVAGNYDVVVLDPPPALGTISLSVMRAATALIIPVPPTVMDFASTTAFFAMLYETIEVLAAQGMPINLDWIKVLLSRVDEGKGMHKEISALMRKVYGDTLCRASLHDSAEVDNATARLMTVYELDQPVTSRATHNRAVKHLDAVCKELEIEIRRTWPTHSKKLLDEALA